MKVQKRKHNGLYWTQLLQQKWQEQTDFFFLLNFFESKMKKIFFFCVNKANIDFITTKKMGKMISFFREIFYSSLIY